MATIMADGLRICTDCAEVSANGTDGHCVDCHSLPDGSSVCEARMRTIKGITNLWGAHPLIVGEPDGFAHRQCDGCGSVLSGDRWTAVVFV
jgi:hypothetical protein